MEIKPLNGFLPALDETREEERRKKKKEERQKTDKPAGTPETSSSAAANPSATPSETLSQISDSESLVKLLEHAPQADAHKPNPYRTRPNAKKS